MSNKRQWQAWWELPQGSRWFISVGGFEQGSTPHSVPQGGK